MYKLSIVAALSQASAFKVSQDYRPVPGTAPWHNPDESGPTPDFPHGYKVPDFGVDHDVLNTQSNIKEAEKEHNHKWVPKQDGVDGRWVVPVEHNDVIQLRNHELLQIQSDPITSSAGLTQYLHPPAPESHPVDYFVPNFGKDQQVLDTESSLKQAEKLTG